MNANAKAWVAALRSRRYKQARGRLRRDDAFCCLGVACELAAQAGVIPRARYLSGHGWSYAGHQTLLPPEVAMWLGLKGQGGAVSLLDGLSLVQVNDSGWSFAKIAELIESEPPGLFAEEQ